jgi:hypothetical protein
MRRLLAAAIGVAVIASALLLGIPAVGRAQTASPTPPATGTPAPPGSVTGTITNGTQGATGIDGVTVQLLALTNAGDVTSQDGTVEDGKFSFSPPADSAVTYVLRVTYEGVSYLVDPPILLSPGLPTDHRDVTVYQTTSDVPADLRIDSTVMSVQGLDRAQAQLTLQREDQVVNSTDRVYVGGEDKVSLRMPAPDGVIQLLDATTVDGEAKLDGGTVTTDQPLKPGTNLVVTRYLVGYDLSADDYRMRVTAPLPAASMEIWVPDRFVDDLTPEPGAIRAPDQDLQGERWHIVRRSAAAAEGESLVATIEGLSGGSAVNPLTQRTGAVIGAALAILGLLGAVVLFSRMHFRWGGEAPA